MEPETETIESNVNQPAVTGTPLKQQSAYLMPGFFSSLLSFLFFRYLSIFAKQYSLEINGSNFIVTRNGKTILNSEISQIKVKYVSFGGIFRTIINNKRYDFVFSNTVGTFMEVSNLTGGYIQSAKDWEQQLIDLGASRA